MSANLTRPVLRQTGAWSRMAARRFESSTTQKAAENTKQAASKTAESTKQATSKAAETTKEAASKTAEATKDATSKATETTKEATSKASSGASEYVNKASQGLSRVTSSAGPAITGAAQSVASSLGRIGGRTGRLIGFVERHTPTVLYYSRVTGEVAKIVFQGQKMSPPSVSTFQSYFQRAWKSVQNPSALLQTASETAAKTSQQPATLVQRARNISTAQLVGGGIVAAECIGFFTVGEMLGRFKIVGYHGDAHAAHR